MVILSHFFFEAPPHYFPQGLCHFTFPSAVRKDSNSIMSSPHLAIFWVFIVIVVVGGGDGGGGFLFVF